VSEREPTPVLTILGSGTALPDAGRHSAAHHLALGRASVLLDCGPGTLHGLPSHGVDWVGITHVAISHYHHDHVGDLAALPFAMRQPRAPRRSGPLTLVGPVGFRGFLERLSRALGPHVLEPGFEVRVHEMEPGAAFDDGSGFALEAHPTPHTEDSVAYRVRGEWGVVGYTGDTGPSAEVAAFLRGCDVLVSECALTDPPEMDRHLSPSGVVELATVSSPDLLVLTHVYPGQSPEEAAEQVRAGYPGAVVAGRDGTRIALSDSGPVVDPTPEAV
jgi:ribonuclease BN (tRNA processing enzyme)